jgi:phytoene dehydrogenase-like protein
MYDALIIGAGMSGLAAGIRLAMFGQKVCILERHYAVGGLNSYYRLNGRNYDVGLHALTNFAPRGAKHGPLPRLLRQLRIRWDDLELAEQVGSTIRFPSARLRFSNDPGLLVAEIERVFPAERDNYQGLLAKLCDYDQLMRTDAAVSARHILQTTFSNPLLAEMVICPVLFYGGAREHDLDWGSFSVLFRAIFLEGLARPCGGIRVVLKQLVRRFKELGGQLRLRAGVKRIVQHDDRAVGVELDDGEDISARQIISSAGWNETIRLCKRVEDNRNADQSGPPGRMTFLETTTTEPSAVVLIRSTLPTTLPSQTFSGSRASTLQLAAATAPMAAATWDPPCRVRSPARAHAPLNCGFTTPRFRMKKPFSPGAPAVRTTRTSP